MKQLIVNADDLGADAARNEGILQAVAAGVVTSVSVLANGPASEDAADRLRALPRGSLSVGAHLNLSEGFPLSGDLQAIVGSDGAFLGKRAAREKFFEELSPTVVAEVEREVESQLRWLEDRFGPLDHLDGHQHVHVFPCVFPAAVRAAERHGIGWIRTPDEFIGAALSGVAREAWDDAAFFSRWGKAARSALKSRFVRAPEGFRGLKLRACLGAEALLEVLASLPEGLTELMVHPGRAIAEPAGPFSHFSTEQREKELEVLLSPWFEEAIRRANVILSRFPRTLT